MTMARISALGALVVLISGCSKPDGIEVSRADFGDQWPLTVESGYINCIGWRTAVFHHGGQTYALNGLAKGEGFAPLDPIWRDNPGRGGPKMSVDPLLSLALKRCP